MAVHWIVIADASRARIYAADALLRHFELIDSLEHPESRLRTSELVSDGPGASQAGPGGDGRTRMVPRSDPADHEHEAFAHEIAEMLGRALEEKHFERLILTAPPRFLGSLRRALPEAVAGRLLVAVHRDYTTVPTDTLVERLREHLPT